MDFAIKTENLTKEFIVPDAMFNVPSPFGGRKSIVAVDNISIEIKKGESLGLVGANGSGKTTLLKLLATLILPTRGSAHVNGYNVVKEGRDVRGSVGLVLGEQRSFYWRLTGRQNLNLFAALYKLSAVETVKTIKSLSSFLEIEKYMDNIFYRYSAGVKQRFSIARSLLGDPQILLLDEPTKSLDSAITEKLSAFIKRDFVGKQGKTVLFSTHDCQKADIFSDRIAIIEQGKIRIGNGPDGLSA